MICKFCGSEALRKSGITRKKQRYFVKVADGIKLLVIIEKNILRWKSIQQ